MSIYEFDWSEIIGRTLSSLTPNGSVLVFTFDDGSVVELQADPGHCCERMGWEVRGFAPAKILSAAVERAGSWRVVDYGIERRIRVTIEARGGSFVVILVHGYIDSSYLVATEREP